MSQRCILPNSLLQMKCMQPIAEPEDSAVDQVLIRKLSSELQHLLADEDLESVEECATKIAAANSKLQDLISRNCGDTKAANSQRTLLESLNVIMAKHQEVCKPMLNICVAFELINSV